MADMKVFEAVRENNIDELMQLIKQGAEINKDSDGKDLGETPLHNAINREFDDIAIALIENGADVNASKRDGITVLHFAAYFGRSKVAKLLIEKGANRNATDQNGNTPKKTAMLFGKNEMFDLL